MKKHLTRFIGLWISVLSLFALQSCQDQSISLEKQKVRFTFSTGSISNGRVDDIELPENTHLRLSITTSAGVSVLSNHEIEVLKVGDTYMADPLELTPGTYAITDFMLVKEDEVLYATPKSESPLSAYVEQALPFQFSVAENTAANVSMQVIDVRDEEPEAFGYASFKVNVVNTLAVSVFGRQNGQTSLTNATAELRQGKKLIKKFSLDAATNIITFEGDPDATYTLAVYSDDQAKINTFNFRQLKEELGSKPFKITLEPALLLTIDSYDGEYEFEFVIEGTGEVAVNWGDGETVAASLPFYGAHLYTHGDYQAIVTGDLNQITDFGGFSYSTTIQGIQGLTNLTSLKVYNPSWGAVPVNVDLSNCRQLERIYIEKHGSPYEPVNLLTDFKLPEEHFISEFVFYASSLDGTRDRMTTEELAFIVSNIYHNTAQREIYSGTFMIESVEAPSPQTQELLDALRDDYFWDVQLYPPYDYSSGRTKSTLETRRKNWLREKFPNSVALSRGAKVAFNN